jgi:hypothetical protein
MHQKGCFAVKFSEGLGIFDHHYEYPQIDYQEIYDGPTGKVIDIQGIEAHAGQNFFVPEGKEFSFDIDECPYFRIAIKAEPGTNTCLFLLVHERKHDWNRRFVVIGKTPEGECRYHLMSNHFTIEADNNWHEHVYDLRKIREEEDNNVYHQRLCPDAGSIREIQFYSWTGSGAHTFYFGPSKAPVEVCIKDLPPWLQSLFTPRRTNRRAMSGWLHYLPSKERFERLVKNFENIPRLGVAQKTDAYYIIIKS